MMISREEKASRHDCVSSLCIVGMGLTALVGCISTSEGS